MILLRKLRRIQNRRKALKQTVCDFFGDNRCSFYSDNAIHHLNKAGIHRVEQLVGKTDKEILALPRIGECTVGYIATCLNRVGLGFKQ